jgi:hypothetical protein
MRTVRLLYVSVRKTMNTQCEKERRKAVNKIYISIEVFAPHDDGVKGIIYELILNALIAGYHV